MPKSAGLLLPNFEGAKLLLTVLLFLGGNAWGQYSGAGTFTKITSMDDLTDGYYVIVNSGDAYAMNSTNAGSYFTHTAVTPVSGVLTNPATDIVWKIETNGGGRSIYNEVTQKYVSYTGSSNAAYAVDAVNSDSQRWTFSYASNLFNVANLALTTRVLQYNASSPRFACYTSAQQKLLLYKMGSAPTDPTITVGSLTGFGNQQINTTSSEKTYDVSGSNLTANIAITPPAGFLISTTSGSGYASTPITLTQSGGTVSSTPIYVVFNPTLAQAYSDNITHESSGATTMNVAVSGTGTNPPPPDAPVAAAATAVTATGFTANWNAVAGATGYELDVYTMSAGTNATDLFFSEYIEGSSYNKALEIYNGTGISVDLSNYTVDLYGNGASSPTATYTLSGTLANGGVYVLAHSSANAAIIAFADYTFNGGVLNFNGDDAVALVNGSTNIDVLGTIGSTAKFGENVTLVRKSSITSPNITYSSAEWDNYPNDTFSYLGSHTMAGGSSQTFVPGYENLDVGNVTSYNVTGLTTGTTYYYVVRATNTYGTSANSNEIEVTTTGGNQNPVITNIVQSPASGINSTTTVSVSADVTDSDGTVEGVELHWGTASGNLSNNIDMSLSGGSTYTTDSNIPAQSAGTTVYYEVYALDDDAAETTSAEQSYQVEVSEPSAHPTGFSATANSSSAITVNWTDADPAADGYLIKGSSVGYGDIAVPVDGTAETNSLLVQNVAAGVETFQFTSLTASTTYYFKIYPYNGSSAAINYKIDGTVPETSATTDAATAYDNVETFDNFGATGNSYSSGTFEGQDGSTWTYTEARGDVEITGKALMVGRNRTPQSEVYSGTLGGGIQVLNFDYMQAFGTNVNLNVLVNDVVVGNVTSTSELELVKNSGDITVNISGNFVLKFKNVNNSNGQVVIDNISWNSISAFSAYNGTGNWTNTSNWSNGLPTGTTDVIINGNVTVDDVVECNDMTVSPTGAVTVGAGPSNGLIVNGNFLIESNATGTGSFIGAAADYAIGGTTTVQRYLTGGWDDWDAGWHQLSSPVAAQPIADFATTGSGNDYDFYGWSEPTATWMNYKAAGFSTWNGGTNFNVGQGYLVSYEAANTTQTFTGELNTADVVFANLSNGGASFNGWHLLGNPFASALVWNDGNWILNNTAGNAKIWHETNKSYSDIAASGIIPSAQGFMVQVSSATNGVGIPGSSRTHSATPFYKSVNEQLLLVAAETEGGSAQESKIMVNPMATEGFDFDYDSRFLAGYAPQLYSVVGDEMLSTSSLPELASGKVIPLGFVKNAATAFTIELKESIPAHAVYLTDKKTDIVTNLTETPVYSFTSSEGDDPNRFELKFGAVGIDDNIATKQTSIYSNGQLVYISSTKSANALINIYNVTGQQVYANTMVIDGQKQIALNTPTGWYIVKVTTATGVATQKVFIKSNQ